MGDNSQKIKKAIIKIISNEVLIKEVLKNMIITFIEKEQFSFGELCVLHYEEYCGNFDHEIYEIAAAIELIVIAFDIVDDLQDQDKPYIWTETPELSLNAVLVMLTVASKIIRNSNFEHAQSALNHIEEYILSSINGQHLDLLNQCNDETSYLQMIEMKSASLSVMSCVVGTVLATGKVSEEIIQYAKALGIIQQIKNDIHGLKDWNQSNDLLNKKYSLPIIYLFSMDHPLSFQLKRYYQGDRFPLNTEEINNFVIDSGALQYALAIKNVYKSGALLAIENVVTNKEFKSYLKKIMK